MNDGKKTEERFQKIEDELKTIKVFFDNRGFKVFSDNKPTADFTPDGVIHIDEGYVLGKTIIESPTHKFDGMTDEEVWNGYQYFKNSTEEYEKEIEKLKKHYLSDDWAIIIQKAITVIEKEKTKKRRWIRIGINTDIVINELQLNAMFDEFIKILTNKIT